MTSLGSNSAQELFGTGLLIAPDLILPDTMNALWAASRRGRLAPDQLAEAARLLSQRFDWLEPSEDLIVTAVDPARRTDHTVYDRRYLALGLRIGAGVVTADRRLMEAAHRSGVDARSI